MPVHWQNHATGSRASSHLEVEDIRHVTPEGADHIRSDGAAPIDGVGNDLEVKRRFRATATATLQQ